jgi:hypothetical protein
MSLSDELMMHAHFFSRLPRMYVGESLWKKSERILFVAALRRFHMWMW